MRRTAKTVLDPDSARARAEALCRRAETCSTDLRRKLLAWGLGPEEAAAVLRQLTADRFVDDERYARAYAQDKFRFNGRGRRKIARLLQTKRIDPEIREAACAGIEEEACTDRLRHLLQDKARTMKARDRYERRVKLFRFALGRGFDPDRIRALLEEVLAGESAEP
jgi:regulatory protein